MNIHCQPDLPLSPSIFSIAAARRPEKAPDRDAAEKKIAILYSVFYEKRTIEPLH